MVQKHHECTKIIEEKHSKVIPTLISLIQSTDENVVRLSLTALIALTAPPNVAAKANPIDKTIEELEERANEPMVKIMLVNKVIDRAMNHLILLYNKTQGLKEHEKQRYDYNMELLCILLANLTTLEQGVGRLLQLRTFVDAMDEIKLNKDDDEDLSEESDTDSDEEDWAQGYFFKKLMELFLQQPVITLPWEVDSSRKYTRWIANVFTNVSTTAVGRTLFLREKEDSDTSFAEKTGVKFAMQNLFPYTRDEDLVKRRGVFCTIKNCLFVKEKHFMMRQTPLLNILLNRLSSDDVETNNPVKDTTTANDKFHYQEHSVYLRRVISECLLMLTSTNAGMDQMSTESVYKMLETQIATTKDEKTKSNLEKLLHRLNKRLKNKNNMSDDGRLIRLEYVDDDEEGDNEGEQQSAEENVETTADAHDDID